MTSLKDFTTCFRPHSKGHPIYTSIFSLGPQVRHLQGNKRKDKRKVTTDIAAMSESLLLRPEPIKCRDEELKACFRSHSFLRTTVPRTKRRQMEGLQQFQLLCLLPEVGRKQAERTTKLERSQKALGP